MKDNDNGKISIPLIVYFIIFIVIAALILIIKQNTSINVVLDNKYDNVICISKCKYIISKNNDSYKILNKKGVVIGKFKNKNNILIYKVNKKYILVKTKKGKKVTYSIYNLRGKEKYKTKNYLGSINNKLIYEIKEGKLDYTYDIYDYFGKEIISKLTDFEEYNDGKLIYGTINGKSYLFKSNGKEVLNGYKVEEVIENDAILKDVSSKNFYYYNIKTNRKNDNSFKKYVINSDNNIEIARKENNKYTYLIIKNGKEKYIDEEKSIFTKIEIIKNKLGNNYNLYEKSVKLKSNYVLVDNKSSNSFGIYNIKTKSFNALYLYNSTSTVSDIYELNSVNNTNRYMQIICDKPICKNNKMFVYDSYKGNIVFNTESTSKVADEFILYKKYKVVHYSVNSTNEEYKNKYVLYDNKNQEIIVKEKPIIVIGSKLLFGSYYDNSLIYNTKSKKIINEESLSKIYSNFYITYSNKIININGKKIYTSPKGSIISYSNSNFYVINRNKNTIKLFDASQKKLYSYELNSNETLYADNNKILTPFINKVIVQSKKGNYIKIVNVVTGDTKVIKKNNIYMIKDTSRYKYIITKNNKKYGLIILK